MLALQNNQSYITIDLFLEVWHHVKNLQKFCRWVYANYQINKSKMWECFYINTTAFLQVSYLYVEFSKIAVISKLGINFLFFWPSFSVLKKGPKRLKMHTFLRILRLFLILDLHIWNFQITCTIHFSINLSPLFTILGISVNYQTQFLQVSDMVPDFQECIYRGVTLIVFESLHYHRYFLKVLILSD